MVKINKKLKLDKFVKDLSDKQQVINDERRNMAKDIVDNQNLTSLDDAKRFAQAWIVSAAQFATNEEYWCKRALAAEKRLTQTKSKKQ
jgi:hypothetical protein